MNKEAIQQAEAFLKTNRAFYGEEGFQAYGPYGEKAVALMIAEFAAQCAPVGEAPQIDYRQFVKDYWCLLSTDMDKLDSIELTVTPHQLVAMLKEYAKGGEKYVPEASNTDEAPQADIEKAVQDHYTYASEHGLNNRDSFYMGIQWGLSRGNYGTEASTSDLAAVVTPHSSSGNSVEQVPRTGRIHYGGYAQHIIHYVIADDNKEWFRVSEASKKIAGDRMAEQQKQKKEKGYDGPFGLPHHCFHYGQSVSFTVDEAGEAVIIF